MQDSGFRDLSLEADKAGVPDPLRAADKGVAEAQEEGYGRLDAHAADGRVLDRILYMTQFSV